MADNETTGDGKAVATDKVTYSGDADQNVQLVRTVQVTGSEGAKTVIDLPGDSLHGQYVNVSNMSNYDMFGRTTVTSANNDIDVQFFRGSPEALVKVTTANSATATSNLGGALFSSSTNANGSVQGVSNQTTVYRSGSEIYCIFTAAFTAGIANSYMRIGLYDANNGLFLGYEGVDFKATVRNNANDSLTVAKASFSEDTLTGAATSRFTRAGTPESIDLTKLNVFRIRFGWLGSAPVFWEVMAPDGHWVCFHKTLFPNLQASPSIRDADLPMTLDITKTAAAATDLTIQTDCWGAGSASGDVAAQQDVIGFQTSTNLTASSTYSSGVLSLSPAYSQVQTTAYASHDGTINIYWYTDAGGTDLIRTLTITYTAANGFQMYSAPAFTQYVKYEWVNGGTNQTDFYFDSKFLRRPLSPQILRVDGPLAGGMVSSVSRAILAAYNGTDYTNIGSTAGNNLKVSVQELSDGVDVGNGAVGAETLRVTLANDSTGVVAATQSGTWNITNISGTVSLPTGASTETTLATVETNTDFGTVVGGGAEATALRVTIANDSTGVVSIDDNAGSITVDNGGTFAVQAAQSGTWTVQPGNTANTTPWLTTQTPATSGGLTTYHLVSAATTNATSIKASAGQVFGWYIYNSNAAARKVAFHNTAGTPTAGASVYFSLVIPPTSGANVELTNGIAFSTGIAITTVTELADSGTTAVAAEDLIINIWYK